MTQYRVEMHVEGREVYIVEAETAEQAAENWMDGWLEVSEVFSMDLYTVTEEKE